MRQTDIATISARLRAFAAIISPQSEYILPEATKLSCAAVYLPSEPLLSGIDFCFLPNIALIYSQPWTAIDYLIGLFGKSQAMKQTLHK